MLRDTSLRVNLSVDVNVFVHVPLTWPLTATITITTLQPSPDHLDNDLTISAFKASTGMPPHRWQQEARLQAQSSDVE